MPARTNGTVYLDGHILKIVRSGLVARATVGRGVKEIPVESITAIQWKSPGLSTGMIQFALSGGSERRSRFGHRSREAMRDESGRVPPAPQAGVRVPRHGGAPGDQRWACTGTCAAAGHPGPAPGWYQDPDGTGQQRWWDGATWTEHRQAP